MGHGNKPTARCPSGLLAPFYYVILKLDAPLFRSFIYATRVKENRKLKYSYLGLYKVNARLKKTALRISPG